MQATIEDTTRSTVTGAAPTPAEGHPAPASHEVARTGRRIWLMAGLLASGAGPARAAPAVARPFQTLVSGAIQSTGNGTFQLAGSGVTQLMGAVQHGGPVAITSVNPETGVIADTLTETFTAADGSSLVVLCQQIATPVPGSPGVHQSTDQWVVVGGTGRFKGASGSGTGSPHVDLDRMVYVKQCGGSITF